MAIINGVIDRISCRPVLVGLCALSYVFFALNSAHAQDWRFEPIVAVGFEYNDNATLRFRTDEEVVLKGYLVDLILDVKYLSETTSFTFRPRATLSSYPDEPDFDSNDYYLTSRFRHSGRSNDFSFRVIGANEPIRRAELIESDIDLDDPDEIGDVDSGRVFVKGRRTKWRLTPDWKYRFSNVSSIGARIDYFDVRYDEVLEGLLNDFTDARLYLNFRRTLSDVNTLLVTATSRKFDSDGRVADMTGYGAMVGLQHALSQKMRLTAMIGLEESQFLDFTTDPEVVGYVTLTRNLETIRMFAQYRRSVSASGSGTLSKRDSINVNLRRRLSEKISAGIGVRAYKSRGFGGPISDDDRNYMQLQANFRWYLSRSFFVETDYRYTVYDRSSTVGERANSNRINLWFTFQPNTIPRI